MTSTQGSAISSNNSGTASSGLDQERHLLPIEPGRQSTLNGSNGRIVIQISRESASSREGQLLLWMTANLCARMRGVVREIEFSIPGGIDLYDSSIVPFI